MKLYYENGYKGTLEYIADCADTNEAVKIITDFWSPIFQEKLGYELPYVRVIHSTEYYWFDYGSHVCFYRLYKEGFVPKGEDNGND